MTVLLHNAAALCCAHPTGSSASGSALELHNQYRQRHGGPALSWSSSIASQAQAYASRCVFEHSGTRGVGENLAMGHRSWAAVVQDWYSESAGFNYGSSSGTSGGGHFSQLASTNALSGEIRC